MDIPSNIALKLATVPNTYVSADGNNPSTQMIANRPAIGPWEEFVVVSINGNTVALKTSTGSFVQVHADCKLYPTGSSSQDESCQFLMTQAIGGTANVNLQSISNNKYWSVRLDAEGWLECSVSNPEAWETFHFRSISP